MSQKYTLAELRTLKDEWLQRAQDEEIPPKAVQIANLGETYSSPYHGDYHIFPMMYGSHYAVFTHHHKDGCLIEHGRWEQVDEIYVTIQKNFNPYKLDKHNEIPFFWDGLLVMRWTISDFWEQLQSTDLFIPGAWWDKAQEYLPQAQAEIKKSAKQAVEAERLQLYEQLLIGKEI